ncbi:hypothetical protein H6504_03555 [Candidatus Woesearchaeota archaeon]|nr:hypothetical protein [Candidatus Woesearchaeota archaeon]
MKLLTTLLAVLLILPSVAAICEDMQYAQYPLSPELYRFYLYDHRAIDVTLPEFQSENPTITLGQQICLPKKISNKLSLSEGETIINLWQFYGAPRGYSLSETALKILDKQDPTTAALYRSSPGRFDPYSFSVQHPLNTGTLDWEGAPLPPQQNENVLQVIDTKILPSTLIDELILDDLQGIQREYSVSEEFIELITNLAVQRTNSGVDIRVIVLETSFLDESSISYNAIAASAFERKFKDRERKQAVVVLERDRAISVVYNPDLFDEEIINREVAYATDLLELGDSSLNILKSVTQGIVDAS